MSRTAFSAKTPSETVTEVFDFENKLSTTETITSASVTAVVYSGTDASPSSLISGSASISGARVSQNIVGGVEGVIYLLTCTVVTTTNPTSPATQTIPTPGVSQTLQLSGYLPVLPAYA